MMMGNDIYVKRVHDGVQGVLINTKFTEAKPERITYTPDSIFGDGLYKHPATSAMMTFKVVFFDGMITEYHCDVPMEYHGWLNDDDCVKYCLEKAVKEMIESMNSNLWENQQVEFVSLSN